MTLQASPRSEMRVLPRSSIRMLSGLRSLCVDVGLYGFAMEMAVSQQSTTARSTSSPTHTHIHHPKQRTHARKLPNPENPPVDDAVLVEVLEAEERARGEVAGLVHGEAPALVEVESQVPAPHQVEDEEEVLLGGEGVLEADDEGRVDEREDAPLVPAELLRLVRLDAPLVHHLHRVQLSRLAPLAPCGRLVSEAS